MFEGAGEPGIFSVPEGNLGIFPSPRAYMEETVRRVTTRTSLRQRAVFGEGGLEFFKIPESKEKLGIFLSPRAYIEREMGIFLKSRSLHGVKLEISPKSQSIYGESLEFFKVPESI